jgi:hypothetical protein
MLSWLKHRRENQARVDAKASACCAFSEDAYSEARLRERRADTEGQQANGVAWLLLLHERLASASASTLQTLQQRMCAAKGEPARSSWGPGSRVPWPVEHELILAATAIFFPLSSDVQRKEYVR